MSATDSNRINSAKEEWAKATTQADKDYWHAQAESVRAKYGYSGGVDGSGDTSGGNGGYDVTGIYDNALKSKKSALKGALNSNLNTLKNNYQSSLSQYDTQKNQLAANYLTQIQGIHDQTYQNAEQNKILSAQRGVMQSEQGLASRQNVVRAGSNAVNNATQARDTALNDIATAISNLTNQYNNNVAQAKSDYQNGLITANYDNQSQLAQANLDMFKYNTDYQRQTQQLQQQHQWAIDLNNLDYEHQTALANLGYAAQERLARLSAGMSSSQLQKQIDAEYNTSQANMFASHFAPYTSKYNGATQKVYDQSILDLYAGKITYDQAWNNIVTAYKNQR